MIHSRAVLLVATVARLDFNISRSRVGEAGQRRSPEPEVGVAQVEHRGKSQLGRGVRGLWVEERLVQQYDEEDTGDTEPGAPGYTAVRAGRLEIWVLFQEDCRPQGCGPRLWKDVRD